MNNQELTWPMITFILKDLGFTCLGAYYDGSGDSGYIEDIILNNDIDLLNEHDVWDLPEGTSLKDADLSKEVKDFIEKYMDRVTSTGEDWWNNEGGYGKCIIDLTKNEYTMGNFIRITDTEYFEHTNNLI